MKSNNSNAASIVQWAWAMYDWAVSVYNLVITSAIFPVYFVAVAVAPDGSDRLQIFGFPIRNSVLYSYALSTMFVLLMILNPILGAISDCSGLRKRFMQFFSYMGALSCIGLFFFTKDTIMWSITLFITAGIGYGGSFVFYNAYLPDISTEEKYDRLSAQGFSLGYIGSVILLVFNLTMIMIPEWYGGISSAMASRYAFLSVGIWWMLFALIPFYFLPKDSPEKSFEPKQFIYAGFAKLCAVWSSLKNLPNTKRFLWAFFFYNMGVQTVMYVATIFAEKELKLPTSNLIATILILQLIAIPGAFLSSYLSKLWGNIKSLFFQICIWILICIGGYHVQNGMDFYLLALIVGLVMGGIQSLSRSTYSKLIPLDMPDKASFYSFYDVCFNASIVVGTFSFGFIEQWTGSARNSILALILFFLIALYMILKVKVRRFEYVV